MRAIVQRVSSAQVVVEGDVISTIGKGLVCLVGAHRFDSSEDGKKLADRIWGLRIFNDEEGKLNLALKELSTTEPLSVLAISNFTVYGETSKNRRPSFIESAPYETGKVLFECFVEALRNLGCHVEVGVFGADMKVSLVNDGPVTVTVDCGPNNLPI